MSDARYEMASQLAADIRAKAEELSTAIYEAGKYGYHAKVVVHNGKKLAEGKFLGVGDPLIVQATIAFDIGDRGL